MKQLAHTSDAAAFVPTRTRVSSSRVASSRHVSSSRYAALWAGAEATGVRCSYVSAPASFGDVTTGTTKGGFAFYATHATHATFGTDGRMTILTNAHRRPPETPT